MTKFNAQEIAQQIHGRQPSISMIKLGADTWRKCCKVLKAIDDRNRKFCPYRSVHRASVAHVRKCGCVELSECIACYEEKASQIINNPSNW